MKGYWNKAEATQWAITGGRTGEADYFDEEGYLYIHDRVKDMVVSGGENIYLAEVEDAIFGHPAMADVAVIGVPEGKWGEAVNAIVVKKPGASVTPDEIIAPPGRESRATSSPNPLTLPQRCHATPREKS